MCGIAGFTGIVEAPELARRRAAVMVEQLRHRGPEASGVRTVGTATLAACELAFFTPGTAHQPVLSDDGRIGAVLNGEIYNHGELRQWLQAAGGPSPQTDTELILHLYERQGPACIARLRGMYALVIHDGRTRETLLARDPLGKKPLYFFPTPQGLVFGSELRALLAHPQCPREIDTAALLSFFVFNAVPSPATPFRGIAKLRPGALLIERRGRIEERRSWELPPSPGTLPASEAPEVLAAALRAAVARRMRSTSVPLGVLLSGGIDSSLVAALAAQESPGPLKTFTAGFADESFDESPDAALLARHLGCEHHCLRLSGADLLRTVTEDLPRIDEPLADPSLIPTLNVCRLARTEVKGVLSGDGADEWLFGYSFFRFAKLVDRLAPLLPRRSPELLTALARRLPVRHSNMHASLVLGLLARGMAAPPERRFYECTAAFSPRELGQVLVGGLRGALADFQPYGEVERFLAGRERLPPLRRCQLGMVRHYLQDVILAKVDRASMLNSLEVRSPFLDLDFVEAAWSCPERVAILDGRAGKPQLREIAAPLMPAAVRGRKKRGFRAPVGRLLCEELRPLLTDLLSPASLAAGGCFEPVAVGRLVREHLERERDHQKPLWALLCFEIWRRNWAGARPELPELEAPGPRSARPVQAAS